MKRRAIFQVTAVTVMTALSLATPAAGKDATYPTVQLPAGYQIEKVVDG